MKKILAAVVALTFVLGAVSVAFYPVDAVAQEKKKDDGKKKNGKKEEKKK